MMMHTAHTTIQSSHTPASSATGAAASGVRASTASNSSQYGPTDLTNFEEDAELKSGAARRTPLVISHSQRTSFDLGADSHRTSFSTAHSPSSLAGSLPSPVGPAQAAARRPSSAYSTPERGLEGLSGPVFGAPLIHFSGLPAAMQPRPASQPTISATNPASRFAVLRRPTRHDPYAPLPERVPTPPARSTPPATIYHGISHQPLVHRCRYVAWPARLAATDSRAATPVVGVEHLPRLVIDQVKFEMSPAQLRWLIRELTGVVAVSVEEASRGCFVARFRNESDFELARKMNRAVLFDHNGAWCPAGPEESVAVAQYMATREFRQRGQRLPRELIVVSKSGPRRSPTFA